MAQSCVLGCARPSSGRRCTRTARSRHRSRSSSRRYHPPCQPTVPPPPCHPHRANHPCQPTAPTHRANPPCHPPGHPPGHHKHRPDCTSRRRSRASSRKRHHAFPPRRRATPCATPCIMPHPPAHHHLPLPPSLAVPDRKKPPAQAPGIWRRGLDASGLISTMSHPTRMSDTTLHTPCAVLYLMPRACRMLIGAGSAMLCPIHRC